MAGEERQTPGMSGGDSVTGGERPWITHPVRFAYALLIVIILATALVNTFSIADDRARQGKAYDLRVPAFNEFSSVFVVIALLPFLNWTGALVVRWWRRRVLVSAFALGALLAYFIAHIAGMVALRFLVTRLVDEPFRYPWTVSQLLYEFRKDALAFAMISLTFLLAQWVLTWRAAGASARAAVSSDLWLRDGATSVRIDARDISWVGSAGNYIEYHLAGGVEHLIRGTLAAEEAKLQPFGILRVHRTRLVNMTRAVAIERKATGDFEIRLNTGEVVIGSRRYRSALNSPGAPDVTTEADPAAQARPSA